MGDEHTRNREDLRFKIANREALMGVILAIFNFIWWFAFAYGLGKKPVAEYTYIFGFPAWFFYSCILGFILFSLIVFVMVRLFFIEVPFEDREEDVE
ncbi:YhdT family protein [Pseudalkalibacillus sp. A8]|uniref:YhdT family protein n=1 Tax=Pseudalkalibacillus sp. A8 TaxID=3382641 RepID=UPI0038B4F051